MNTILTDDEISKIASTPCAVVGSYVHTFARAIEAAVLAKLREQEPAGVVAAFLSTDRNGRKYLCFAPKDDEVSQPLYAAPQPAVVQVPQGWRLEVDESAIYHNDKRIAVLEEDGGNQSWRDACALGQQIVDRMNAAHEAPAQADPMEKLTRIQEELGLYDDAQRIQLNQGKDMDANQSTVTIPQAEYEALQHYRRIYGELSANLANLAGVQPPIDTDEITVRRLKWVVLQYPWLMHVTEFQPSDEMILYFLRPWLTEGDADDRRDLIKSVRALWEARACGCRIGTCESKADRLCWTTVEIATPGAQ